MKKYLAFLAVFISMTAYELGDKPTSEPARGLHKPLCTLSLEEQIQKSIAVARVSIVSARPSERAGDYCAYEVTTNQVLLNEQNMPELFKIIEQSPLLRTVNCRPVGSEFFVI